MKDKVCLRTSVHVTNMLTSKGNSRQREVSVVVVSRRGSIQVVSFRRQPKNNDVYDTKIKLEAGPLPCNTLY
jgi:hypothetical protein